MARLVMKRGWQEQVREAADPKLEELGDIMVSEARILAPVSTGRLRNSIFSVLRSHVLTFGAYARYAAAVEFGFGPGPDYNREPQPFIRPPAFRYRGRL